jgi:hypothetical protein
MNFKDPISPSDTIFRIQKEKLAECREGDFYAAVNDGPLLPPEGHYAHAQFLFCSDGGGDRTGTSEKRFVS